MCRRSSEGLLQADKPLHQPTLMCGTTCRIGCLVHTRSGTVLQGHTSLMESLKTANLLEPVVIKVESGEVSCLQGLTHKHLQRMLSEWQSALKATTNPTTSSEHDCEQASHALPTQKSVPMKT